MDYSYDGNGNLTSRSDTTPAVVGSTTSTHRYEYDARNRRSSEKQPDATLTYAWDPAGNLAKLTDSWGTTSYSYDPAHQVKSITTPDGKAISYDYLNPASSKVDYRYRKLAFPNGAFTETSFDDGGRTTKVRNASPGGDLSNLAYDYRDPARSNSDTHFRYKITDSVANTTLTYAYDDPLGRLTSSSGPGESFAYSYDKASNLTSVNAAGVVTNYSYNAANQRVSDGSRSYSYDANGNLLGAIDGSLAFEYNAKNQTSRVEDGETDRTMAYAGNSQVERTRAGSATFVNSILGVNRRSQLLDEEEGILDIDTSGTTRYIRDPSGNILGQRRVDSTGLLVSTHYVGTDGLGSVRHVTDSNGNQKNSYRFGPYGETVAAGEQIYNPWRFAGQYDDDPNATAGPTSALYKMGMRYYQPGQRHWTQPDPLNQIANLGVPADANPYAYAGCNPINYTDLSGASVGQCILGLFQLLGLGHLTGIVGAGVLGAAGLGIAGAVAVALLVAAPAAGAAFFILRSALPRLARNC